MRSGPSWEGQLSEKCKEKKQSFTGQSKDTDTCIGGASEGNTEKAGRKAGSVQSIENRVLQNQRRKASIYLYLLSDRIKTSS